MEELHSEIKSSQELVGENNNPWANPGKFPEFAGAADNKKEQDRIKLLSRAIEEMQKNNYNNARLAEFLYVYDMSPGEICTNLTSLGIIKLSEKEKDAIAGAFSDKEEYFEEEISQHKKLCVDEKRVATLLNRGILSQNILDAITMLNEDDDSLANRLNQYNQHGIKEIKIDEEINNIREGIRSEVEMEWSRYMTDTIRTGVNILGEVDYSHNGDNMRIPLLQMSGDNFALLVHRLGGIYSKTDSQLDDPSFWDEYEPQYWGKDGQPVDYISTSAISDELLDLAGREADGSTVLYGFSELSKNSFLYSADDDLDVTIQGKKDSKKIICGQQDYYYHNPHDLAHQTVERINRNNLRTDYNEVVLNRYPGGSSSKESRLKPDYIVFYGDDKSDISDKIKKHAAYFDIPILMISPSKYGRK